MSMTDLLTFGGLKSYVASPINLLGLWKGYKVDQSSPDFFFRLFKMATDYKSTITAFECFTTFPKLASPTDGKTKYVANKKSEVNEKKIPHSEKEKTELFIATFFGWTYSCCEFISHLQSTKLIHLSPNLDLTLGWAKSVSGGVSAFLNLKVLSTTRSRFQPSQNEGTIGFSRGQNFIDLLAAVTHVSILALSILYSPASKNYNLKNAQLYALTGLVVSRFFSFISQPYLFPSSRTGLLNGVWLNIQSIFKGTDT